MNLVRAWLCSPLEVCERILLHGLEKKNTVRYKKKQVAPLKVWATAGVVTVHVTRSHTCPCGYACQSIPLAQPVCVP